MLPVRDPPAAGYTADEAGLAEASFGTSVSSGFTAGISHEGDPLNAVRRSRSPVNASIEIGGAAQDELRARRIEDPSRQTADAVVR